MIFSLSKLDFFHSGAVVVFAVVVVVIVVDFPLRGWPQFCSHLLTSMVGPVRVRYLPLRKDTSKLLSHKIEKIINLTLA